MAGRPCPLCSELRATPLFPVFPLSASARSASPLLQGDATFLLEPQFPLLPCAEIRGPRYKWGDSVVSAWDLGSGVASGPRHFLAVGLGQVIRRIAYLVGLRRGCGGGGVPSTVPGEPLLSNTGPA